MLKSNTKAVLNELRRYPRVPAGTCVTLGWGPEGNRREASGVALDISAGGARIQMSEVIAVSTSVHLRFAEFDMEADGVVRHFAEGGLIGVEFTRLSWSRASIYSHPSPFAVIGKSEVIPAVVLILSVALLLLTHMWPDWMPFSQPRGLQGVTWTPGFFTLGSTKQDVQAVQGPPTTTGDTVWHYGSSRIYFRSDRVVGWFRSPDTPLKVGVKEAPAPKTKPDHFTVGSTVADVLVVQGPPTVLTEDVWQYGASVVYLREGRVVGWKIAPAQPLKVAGASQPGQPG